MTFTNGKLPRVRLGNFSDVVAEHIKWSVIVFNLGDLSPRNEKGVINPLPIPFQVFDFLRGHSASGSQGVFESDAVAVIAKPGTRLFGYSTVTCPNCVRERVFWVFIEMGLGGWYAEVADGSFDGKEFVRTVHEVAESTDPDTWLLRLVPAAQRIQIPE